MAKEESLKSRAIYNLIGKTVEFVLRVGTPLVLVRLFTQAQFGFYQEMLVISKLMTAILSFNFAESLFYFYPSTKTRQKQSEMLSQTVGIIFLIGIAFLALSYLFKTEINGFAFNGAFSGVYLVLALLVFFSLFAVPMNILFLIEGKGRLTMIYAAVNQLCRLGLLLAAVLMFRLPVAAAWALVILALLNTVCLIAYLIANYSFNPFSINWHNLKRQFKYVLPMGFGNIVQTVGMRADQLILTALFTTQDFALYSVGSFRLPMIALIYTSVGNVVLTRISEYSTDKNNKGKVLSLWRKMVVKNATVTIPAVIFSLILANPIITFLFGDEYGPSVVVFQISMLIFFIQMLGYGYVPRGYADTRFIFLSYLARMIVSVSAGYMLIKGLGIKGAALSFTIAFYVEGLFQLFRTRQILQVRWSELMPWPDLLSISVVSLLPSVFLIMMSSLELPRLVFLVGSGLLYFSVVFACLIRLRYLPFPRLFKIKSFVKVGGL